MRALKALATLVAMVAALAAGGVLAVGVGSVTHPAGRGTAPAVSACTGDPLTVSLAVAYTPALRGYGVSGVTVTDTSAAPRLGGCAGASYRVVLRGAGGVTLAALSGTVPPGATSFSPASGPATPVAAAAVSTVSLSLGG